MARRIAQRLLHLARSVCLVILVLQLASVDFTEVALARGPSVTDTFKAAVKAYRNNNLKKAAKLLQANIRRYPNHQPTLLLLARILYGLGKIKAAAKIFRRIPVAALPGYMLYDYGVTMFSVRDCQRATSALSKVSSKSKYRFLASFYLGVCYYRNRDLQRAEFFLRKADQLPSNLALTRRRLLQELKDQRGFHQSGSVAPIAGFVYVPPPPPVLPYYGALYSGAPPGTIQPPGREAKAPVVQKPEAGLNIAFKPAITFDRFGLEKQAGKNSRNSCFGILDRQNVKGTVEMRYDFEPFESGSQPNAKMKFELSDTSQQFSEDKFEVCEGDSIEFKDDAAGDKSISLKDNVSTSLKAVPSVTVPILDIMDVEGSYEKAFSLPKREFGDATSSDKYEGKATVEVDFATISGKVVSKDNLNKDGNLTKSQLTLSGSLDLNFDKFDIGLNYDQVQNIPPSKDFPQNPEYVDKIKATVSRNGETFRLTGVFRYDTNTPPAGQQLPELKEETFLEYGATASVSLPLDIGLFAGYFIGEATGARCEFTAEKTCGEGKDDGEQISVGKAAFSTSQIVAGLDYSPFDWVFLAIIYDTSETVASVPKPTAAQFKEDFFDYNVLTQFTLGFKYEF